MTKAYVSTHPTKQCRKYFATECETDLACIRYANRPLLVNGCVLGPVHGDRELVEPVAAANVLEARGHQLRETVQLCPTQAGHWLRLEDINALLPLLRRGRRCLFARLLKAKNEQMVQWY